MPKISILPSSTFDLARKNTIRNNRQLSAMLKRTGADVSDAIAGHHGFLDALERLTPMIEEYRSRFDRERSIAKPVFEALADAGLFRLWLPRALGGPELSPIEFMHVVEAACAIDGSIGWIVANGGGMSRAGGYLDSSVARDWFDDPRTFIVSATGAVGTAVIAEGGFRVTGRWPFGSGAGNATRFMGLASVKDGGNDAQPPICCYFLREDVTVHDTWHVSGLRGTGSSDFEVSDVFVRAEHTHDFIRPAPTQPGLLYRLPTLAIFPWSIAGTPLGIASGAMTAFTKLATENKTRLGTTMRLQDREMVQAAMGRSEALLGAARAFLHVAMTELMDTIDREDDCQMRARINLRIACAHAAESSAGIVQSLASEAGAGVIFEKNGMERAVRDVLAAVKHIAMNPYSYVVAGRLRFGLDLGTSRF